MYVKAKVIFQKLYAYIRTKNFLTTWILWIYAVNDLILIC